MTPRSLHLDGRLDSSSRARRFVAEVLAGQVCADTVDAAVLVTSELVTNATVHAGTPSDVTVDLKETGLLIRVSDGNPRPPVPRSSAPGGQRTGRGLLLMRALCRDWGVDPAPGGKTVWCCLPL